MVHQLYHAFEQDRQGEHRISVIEPRPVKAANMQPPFTFCETFAYSKTLTLEEMVNDIEVKYDLANHKTCGKRRVVRRTPDKHLILAGCHAPGVVFFVEEFQHSVIDRHSNCLRLAGC